MSGPERAGLERYVPRVAAEWEFDAPDARFRIADATLCFVDISGFTKLSERLARKGRIGAEELTEVLNRVFGEMLDLAYARGGALLKFGGDALLLMFEGDDHARQACSAAVEMRAALRSAASIPTSVGRVALRMSVGLHSGLVHLFRVGRLHHELIVTGPAASRTTQMEGAASAGEIYVSADTVERLPRGAAADTGENGAWLLRWRRAPVAPCGAIPRRSASDEAIASCLPLVLRAHLRAGLSEFEHRVATVGFVKFKGIGAVMTEQGTDALAVILDELVTTSQRAAETEGVAFLASDIDDDGGKLILVSGVPTNQADDEGRMLRVARHISGAGIPLDVKIGVNRGHVFAGTVGTAYRATFTIMGDTVNLAARLMAAAPPGAIYTTAPVLEGARSLFDVESVPPFLVKGKSEPVHAFALGAEAGPRPVGDAADAMPFVGRETELADLRKAIDAGEHPIEVVGDTGAGKSRLVREACERAGLPTWTLRGEPTGTTTPYRAFRDPLRELLGLERGTPEAMAEALERVAASIDAELVPFVPLVADVIAVDVASTPEVDAIDPRFRPQRVADVVIRMLDARLATRCAIVVEDSHWTDAASETLLHRVVDASRTRPWTVIAVRRRDEGGFARPDAASVEVDPLPDDDVRAMVVAALPIPLRPHEIDAIVSRAAGSPLFAGELVGVASERGSLDGVPDSLEGVLNAEIDRLPPAPRALLRNASVLGRRFHLGLLRAILVDTGVPADDNTISLLDEYLQHDGDTAEFRHVVARDAAYAGLPYRRRRDLHLRAGRTLERLVGDDPDRAAADLSFHFAAGGDYERAWRYARVAGTFAKSAFDNIDAAAHYRRAIEAARRLVDVDSAELVAAWTALGDVLEQAGELDDALDAYRKAIRIVRGDSVARADLLLKQARARQGASAYASALRDLTQAERSLAGNESDVAARQRVAITIMRALIRSEQERYRVALMLGTEAAAAAGELGDDAQLARALEIVGGAYVMMGEPREAEYFTRAIELYEALDQPGDVAGALVAKGAAAYLRGEFDDALGCYRDAATTFDRIGDVINGALCQANIAEVFITQRRFDDAEPAIASATRTHRAVGFVEGVLFDEIQLGRLESARGDYETAIATLQRVIDEATSAGFQITTLEASIYLAETLVGQGRADQALDVLDAAEAAAGEDPLLAASAALVRATALLATGKFVEAETAATAGIDAARAMGDRYKLGLVLELRADVRTRLGSDAGTLDRDESRALLAPLALSRQ